MSQSDPKVRKYRGLLQPDKHWSIQTNAGAGWTDGLVVTEKWRAVAALADLKKKGYTVEETPSLNWKEG